MEKKNWSPKYIFNIWSEGNVFDVSSPQKLFEQPSLTEVAVNQIWQFLAKLAPERE